MNPTPESAPPESSPRVPSRMEKRHLERQMDLLDVAASCFRNKGFHATSIEEISTAAGVAKASIYRYFVSKEDLIFAVIEQYIDGLTAELGDTYYAEATLQEALVRFISRQVALRSVARAEALFFEVMAEAARDPRVAKLVADGRERVVTWLSDLARNSPQRYKAEWPVRAKVEAVMNAYDALYLQKVMVPGFDMDIAVERLIREALIRLI